jgi:hypothetical protein
MVDMYISNDHNACSAPTCFAFDSTVIQEPCAARTGALRCHILEEEVCYLELRSGTTLPAHNELRRKFSHLVVV